MGKYIKLFETHAGYAAYIGGSHKVLPNVSYCKNENELHYNPWYDPERFVAKFNVTSTTTPTSLFNNPTILKEIEIDGVIQPSVVTSYTFDTTGIHTVKYTLADGTTSIDSSSFSGKPNMISITIPDSVTSIGAGAFGSCSGLTSITIPNSVTSIGAGAFSSCTNLTSVTIPNGVTSIGNGAFGGCRSLTSLTIPSSVTSIGGGLGPFNFEDVVFESVNPNATFVRDATNKVLTNIAGDTLICGFNNTVAIPNSVTSIGSYAFGSCSGLTSITIPNSVTSIGDSAFRACTGLTSVTIPSSITSIGYGVFCYCSGLTSVTIPSSITSIGGHAFYSCSGLMGITIPDSVTSIGASAFYNCTRLTSITIPNSVTSIDYATFSGCSGLTTVTIPSSITSIGNYGFSGCSGLTSITSLATTAPSIGNNTFQNIKTGGTLTVPSGSTGYDVWMGTGNYYLGKYSWTKVEQ